MIKTDCHFYEPKKCKILTQKICDSGSCGFFKTTQQYKAALVKYPPCNYAEIYAAKHKNDMKEVKR